MSEVRKTSVIHRWCTITLISLFTLAAWPSNAQTTFRERNIGIATNIFGYANFLTLNAEASLKIKDRLSVHAGVKYNPFTFNKNEENQMQNRSSFLQIGMRYWTWHANSGWFAGGGAEFGYFNYGGIISKETHEGWRAGMNVTAGYSLMLSHRFNFEFGAGLSTGYRKSKRYACPRCGESLGNDKKIYVAPNNLLAQMVYLF